MPQYRKTTILLSLLLSATMASQAHARGEITLISTESQPATPSQYTLGGQLYEWGIGEDLILKSVFVDGNEIEYNRFTPDKVVVRRVANSRASGRPCAVFAAFSGSKYRYLPSYPEQPLGEDGQPSQAEIGNCDYGKIISSNRLNIGPLDLFANAERVDSIKNIERVDLIFSNGLITPTTELDKSGHVVIEKSGNNHVQIAAITALDEEGQPSAYGKLVMVRPHNYEDFNEIRYGIAYGDQDFSFLSNENKAPQGYLKFFHSKREPMGMAFVSVVERDAMNVTPSTAGSRSLRSYPT